MHSGTPAWAFRCANLNLFTDTQLRDDGPIPFDICVHQVIQEPAALANQLEETATRRMILWMILEVVSQLIDSSGEDGNLDFRSSCVRTILSKLLDDLFFTFFRYHVRTSLDYTMLKKNPYPGRQGRFR